MKLMRYKLDVLKLTRHFSIIVFTLGYGFAAEIQTKGLGWTEFGRIQKSSVGENIPSDISIEGNSLASSVAQIVTRAQLNENWSGALGVGVKLFHLLPGDVASQSENYLEAEPYLAEANFGYSLGGRESSIFRLRAGFFNFNYHPDVHNLGLYLLRGPVYPGVLFSGFESDEVVGNANIMGLHLSSQWSNFQFDVIVKSERELVPYYDYSLAGIVQYNMDDVFHLGLGVNFYRLLPVRNQLTNPRNEENGGLFATENIEDINHPYDFKYMYVDSSEYEKLALVRDTGGDLIKLNRTYVTAEGDTVQKLRQYIHVSGGDTTWFDRGQVLESEGVGLAGNPDTTWYSHQGTKVVGFFSLNLDKLFDINSGMKLYGEAAIIGTKNYRGVYENIAERIPVMLGFDLPVFHFLDRLSVEVEYYKAPWRASLRNLNATNFYSPIPESSEEAPEEFYNVHSDDLKWSLYASKTVYNHIKLSAQVASDHLLAHSNPDFEHANVNAFRKKSDWYWMMRLSYFF